MKKCPLTILIHKIDLCISNEDRHSLLHFLLLTCPELFPKWLLSHSLFSQWAVCSVSQISTQEVCNQDTNVVHQVKNTINNNVLTQFYLMLYVCLKYTAQVLLLIHNWILGVCFESVYFYGINWTVQFTEEKRQNTKPWLDQWHWPSLVWM